MFWSCLQFFGKETTAGYKRGRGAETGARLQGLRRQHSAVLWGPLEEVDPGSGKDLRVSLVRKGLQQWAGRGGRGREELRALCSQQRPVSRGAGERACQRRGPTARTDRSQAPLLLIPG